MAEQSESFEGGCTCGYVRYKMTSKPMFVHACHCRWCQRESGASFAVNALIEADRVKIIKCDVEQTTVPSASGAGQRIARCPKCRIALWSYYLGMSGGVGELVCFIRAGTLDEPELLAPDIHIFISTKQPWIILPPDVRAVDEYYNREATWPRQSLARRAALVDKVRPARS